MVTRLPAASLSVLFLAACGSLPTERPALVDMREPAALLVEPDDEGLRQQLPAGSFSGLRVVDARDTLDALVGQPSGIVVDAVVENSPAAAAGLEVGDLLLEAFTAAGARVLSWPSDWRAIELDGSPGAEVTIVFDRAGREFETTLTLEARVAGTPREDAERFREEARVGVVLRTATEVEARAADLPPGAGAVVVGLSASSPWRSAGVVFEDLVTAVDGIAIGHPEVLVEAIRRASDDRPLTLEVVREGVPRTFEAPVSTRDFAIDRVRIPLLMSYDRTPGRSRWSAILGLLAWESTPAAWRVRLLWLFSFGGGDQGRLEEVNP